MKKFTVAAVAFLPALPVLACSVESATDEAPEVSGDEGIEPEAIVTSVNADGTWTADAKTPILVSDYNLKAKAVFTGPSGKTRKMGVCLLRRAPYGVAGKTCNTVSDCSDAPSSLPSGGYRYCTKADGAAYKKCFYRQGSETTYCVGSPANGYNPIAPGTYTTATINAGPGWYISYACLEGCKASDPSSSSSTKGGTAGGCGGKTC